MEPSYAVLTTKRLQLSVPTETKMRPNSYDKKFDTPALTAPWRAIAYAPAGANIATVTIGGDDVVAG